MKVTTKQLDRMKKALPIIRILAGFTTKDFATELGISIQTLWRLERSSDKPMGLLYYHALRDVFGKCKHNSSVEIAYYMLVISDYLDDITRNYILTRANSVITNWNKRHGIEALKNDIWTVIGPELKKQYNQFISK